MSVRSQQREQMKHTPLILHRSDFETPDEYIEYIDDPILVECYRFEQELQHASGQS